MKNFLKLIVLVALTAILCASFASCSLFDKNSSADDSNNGSASSSEAPSSENKTAALAPTGTNTNNNNLISLTFDQKYVGESNTENSKEDYTFYADQTGIMEYYFVYTDQFYPQYSYVLSGTVDFEWRVASDGYIYLFKTGERYNEDHTDGKTINLTGTQFSFANDFLINNFGSGTHRYILKDSDLEKAIKNE